MTGNLNVLLAFAAGLLSFLSPCILPLIPSFLSFIGGISYADLQRNRAARGGVFLQTLFFVLGFSGVFIGLGVLFSSTAGFLGSSVRILNLVAGGVVIVLGLNFIFNFWTLLAREKRLHFSRRPAGALGSSLLGMAFGAGWTPCVGPILASILILAGSGGQVLRGTLLLAVYSAGLGLPFLLAGLFFSQFSRQAERLKPHLNKIRIASGVFLIFIGLLILLGRLQRLNVFLFGLADALESWHRSNPPLARLALSSVFLAPALLVGRLTLRRRARSPFLSWGMLFSSLLLLLGIFGLTGIIDVTRLFTFWFTFQGI
jgi:cytochrome c-type biogenesis protein